MTVAVTPLRLSGDVPHDSLGPVLHEAAPTTATMEVFTDGIGYLTDSTERFDAVYEPTAVVADSPNGEPAVDDQ